MNTDPLRRILYWFSPDDPITAETLAAGVLLTGSPGSGKTSAVLKHLVMAMLRAGYGGLFLTARPDDTANYVRYIEEAGRSRDLIVFNAQSGDCFDPLFYLFSRPGRTGGNLETVVDMFTTLLAIGRSQNESSSDRFWELAAEELMRNCMVLLSLGGRPISITSINELIDSLPTVPGDHLTPDYQSESFCARLLADVRERQEQFTSDEWSDASVALHYALHRWPSLDDKVRSSVLATWGGLASKFRFAPLSRIFSSGRCTLIPEMTTQERKLLILDFPYLEAGETNRLITCLVKLTFINGWLRRDIHRHPEMAFIVSDECQYHVLPRGRDNYFMQTARGARIISIAATQNLLNISEQFAEQSFGTKTKAWCANIGIKIALQQADPDTNEYYAKVIGREYRMLSNWNAGGQVSAGAHEHLAFILEPDEFQRLHKPTADQPVAEAIVITGGEPFNASKTPQCPRGRNFLRVGFHRDTA